MTVLADYAQKYRFVRFLREGGILEMALHTDGGPLLWGVDPNNVHEELGQAFYDVGRDEENLVVILTGTGDTFCAQRHPGELPVVNTPERWARVLKEGKDLLMNLIDIEVPVIGVVNGPAHRHAEMVVMSDVVLAAEHASFRDAGHLPNGIVPGDGVHVIWPMLLGPNRGRAFLRPGQTLSAQEARQLGVVHEVLPQDKLLARAWEIATDLASKPRLTLRYTRAALTQNIKRRLLEDLGYGLALEGLVR